MIYKILVVDDPAVQALFNKKYSKQIKEKKNHFQFAKDGLTALEILRDNPEICLVIADTNLPDMHGFTLLKEIGDFNREILTVFISTDSDIPNIRNAMRAGAFDFLPKPLDFKDLALTIDLAFKKIQQLDPAFYALKIQRDLLITAVENAGETIMITDIKGNVTYVNEAFEKTTGYSREEI